MHTRRGVTVLLVAAFAFLADRGVAQGAGSCGFHLDLVTGQTSTHAASADLPGAVGFGGGIPPGVAGNPYCAWALPGTIVTFVVTAPAEVLGPAPLGSFNSLAILWSIGYAPLIFPGAPPFVAPCAGLGAPLHIVTFPFGGAIVDGLGLTPTPVILPPVTSPFPGRFEVSVFFPPGLPGPLLFQAVMPTAAGLVAVTNGVSLMAGPSPFEASLLPALVASGATPPLDDGQAVALPAPLGFSFYGFPVSSFDVDTNGFIDFLIGAAAGGGSDLAGAVGDFGCAAATPQARPRVDVNHADLDFSIPPPWPRIADITFEAAPAGFGAPPRHIVRWKNAMSFGSTAFTANFRSCVVELWGDGRIVVVRQSSADTVQTAQHDQIGVGPGVAGQGFAGPPPPVPTCPLAAGTPFAALWGTPGFVGVPGGVIHMDALASSVAFGNLAAVFTPMAGPAPVAYTLTVY